MYGQRMNLNQTRGEDESGKRTVRRAQAAAHRLQSGSEEGGERKSDDEGEETEKAKEKERKKSGYKRAAAVVFSNIHFYLPLLFSFPVWG